MGVVYSPEGKCNRGIIRKPACELNNVCVLSAAECRAKYVNRIKVPHGRRLLTVLSGGYVDSLFIVAPIVYGVLCLPLVLFT